MVAMAMLWAIVATAELVVMAVVVEAKALSMKTLLMAKSPDAKD
jgi:hypothetical protein